MEKNEREQNFNKERKKKKERKGHCDIITFR